MLVFRVIGCCCSTSEPVWWLLAEVPLEKVVGVHHNPAPQEGGRGQGSAVGAERQHQRHQRDSGWRRCPSAQGGGAAKPTVAGGGASAHQ